MKADREEAWDGCTATKRSTFVLVHNRSFERNVPKHKAEVNRSLDGWWVGAKNNFPEFL